MKSFYKDKQILKYAEDLNSLFQKVRSQKRELQTAYMDTIHRLVVAAKYRDKNTGNHIIRMSWYSTFLAGKYGLSSKDVRNIQFASPMHDIGKIGIPDKILFKPGELTPEEFDIIKTHTTIGADILGNSKTEILNLASDIALTHHEKWDGSGYPGGLSGEAIPLAGRIVAVADVFDTITSKRPYKDIYPISMACNIILKEGGKHFDPRVVDIFLENIDAIIKIKEEVDSAGSSTLKDNSYSTNEELYPGLD